MRLSIAIFIVVGLILAGCISCHGQNNGGRPSLPINSGGALPLDEVNGAWGAYSVVRKLRTAYSGNAMLIMKAGGTTNNIGFVGNMVDTNAISTFAAGGACYLVVLYDQASTNDMDKAPGFVDSGINLTNAFALTDNSGNFFLDAQGHVTAKSNAQGTCYVQTQTSPSGNTNQLRLLVFAASGTTNNEVLYCGASTETATIKQLNFGGTKLQNYSQATALVGPTYVLDTQYLVTAYNDQTTTDDYIQLNDDAAIVGDAGNNVGGQPTLGYQSSTACAAFAFSECYVWMTPLVSGDRTSLMDNINAFYVLW